MPTASTTETTASDDESKNFDMLSSKGRQDGLFRTCMKSIRSAHFRANRIRAVLTVAGLFTDKNVYTQVLSLFYVLTRELEIKLQAESKSNEICRKIVALGYHFTDQYEQDLEFLYGTPRWKDLVEDLVQKNRKACEYRDKIRNSYHGHELAGVAFVLYGALIIGGGAAAKPRIEKRFGSLAVHIFQDVSGPGRERRSAQFVQTWDSFVDHPSTANATSDPTNTDTIWDDIVQVSKDCMQLNNDILSSIRQNPWWLYYGIATIGAVTAISMGMIYQKWFR
jgi:hypothetical protein